MSKQSRKMKHTLTATAWRLENWNSAKPPFTYRIQMEYTDGRVYRKIEKTFKEGNWKETGEGWNTRKKINVSIYDGFFDSPAEWIAWAKEFPFPLVQLDRNNKPKKMALGTTPKRKRGRPSKKK